VDTDLHFWDGKYIVSGFLLKATNSGGAQIFSIATPVISSESTKNFGATPFPLTP